MKEVVMCIGFRDSSSERYPNLSTVLGFYRKIEPYMKIVVVEQDYIRTLRERIPPFVDYIFAYNRGSYNRSWGFNVGFNLYPDCDVFIACDCDTIIEKNLFDNALTKIQNDEADIIIPYKYFIDWNRLERERFIGFGIISKCGKERDRYGNYPYPYGGMCFVKGNIYKEMRGYNEEFRGWGGEDEEFILRGKAIYRFEKFKEGKLYHLPHRNPLDCTPRQPNHSRNVELRNKVLRMSREQMIEYCNSLNPDFGNTEKYRGEIV